MKKSIISVSVLLVLIFALVSASLINSTPAEAIHAAGDIANLSLFPADAQTDENVELTCQFPVVSSYAGTSFSYDIGINYVASGIKLFDLKATVPDGFRGSIVAGGYGSSAQEIPAMRLDGTKGYPENIKLTVTPDIWKIPEPGSYPITFAVSSGDIKASIELTAIVTANFDLELTTPDGRLNTEATAGQDNNFTVVVTNSGSGDIANVTVSSLAKDRPANWTVKAEPEKIEMLKSGDSKEVQIKINPSEKTIAGDYMVTIQAEPEAKNAFANTQIRVTVLTPTIWGWVGVAIVILVVVALAVIFIRFGRR